MAGNKLGHEMVIGEFDDCLLEIWLNYTTCTMSLSLTDFYIMDPLVVNARNKTYAAIATHNYALQQFDGSMASKNVESGYSEYEVIEKTRNEAEVYCHSRDGFGAISDFYVEMQADDYRGYFTF